MYINSKKLSKQDVYSAIQSGSFNFIESQYNFYLIDKSYEVNKNFNYETYVLLYASHKSTLNLDISISYFEKEKRFHLSIHVKEYDLKHKHFNTMSVFDYFHKVLKYNNINEKWNIDFFLGDTLQDKLKAFFIWLDSVMDERLENILRGKDWVDIPFDWGPYK